MPDEPQAPPPTPHLLTTDAPAAPAEGEAPAAPADAQQPQAAAEEKPAAQEGAEKPPEEKPAEEQKAAEKPEDFHVDVPEGVEVDTRLMDSFTAAAKDLGLQSAQAQKLVDAYAAAQAANAEAAEAQWQQQQAEWQQQLKADKDVGGQAFERNIQMANQALSRFGGAELVQLLQSTGLSNHPGFVKFAVSVGKAMADDTARGGRGTSTDAAQTEEARLRALYPTMK